MFATCWIIVSLLWSWLFLVAVGRLADQPTVAYITITFAFLVITIISAVIFTVAIWYLRRSYQNKPNWTWLLQATVIWALAEALIAWLVAFVWIGRNGSIDNILPFSSLTPFIMYTPLKFLSRFTGYYGLSAVVVIGIAGLWLKKVRKYVAYYWLVVTLLAIGSWWLYRTPTGTTEQITIVAETLEHKAPVDASGSKLVVLPEYGLDDFNQSKPATRFKPQTDNYYFVGSKQTSVTKGLTNELLFGSKDNGITSKQQKTRLIPGGEYLSFGVEIALRLFSKTTYTDFQVRREVVRGIKPIQPFYIDQNLIIGSEVCSSIMTPRDYRQLTQKGSTVLANSASLEIFEGSRLFAWQHRGLANFMAVANARPFLQSTNHWPAFALDYDGNVVATVQPVGSRDVNIQTNTKKTPYTYLGEWVVILGGVYISVLLIRKIFEKLKQLYILRKNSSK